MIFLLSGGKYSLLLYVFWLDWTIEPSLLIKQRNCFFKNRGSAGLTAAKFARTFGKSVAIIEKGRTGGDCTHSGCIPSKALLKSSEVAQVRAASIRFSLIVE